MWSDRDGADLSLPRREMRPPDASGQCPVSQRAPGPTTRRSEPPPPASRACHVVESFEREIHRQRPVAPEVHDAFQMVAGYGIGEPADTSERRSCFF